MSLQSSLPVPVQPSDRDRSVQGEAEQFKGRWVNGVVVFAPNWAKQSCSLCTHEPSKGTLVSNYSSLYACDCESVHQAMPWFWCYFFTSVSSEGSWPRNSLSLQVGAWDLQNHRALSVLTQQSSLFGLCARIKGFTKLHAEYFNKMHSKSMNYAMLQVRLGHYLNLGHIMVDKAGSVFPFTAKKKKREASGMEKDYFLPPGLLIRKSSSSQSYLCSLTLWTDCAKVSSPMISFCGEAWFCFRYSIGLVLFVVLPKLLREAEIF